MFEKKLHTVILAIIALGGLSTNFIAGEPSLGSQHSDFDLIDDNEHPTPPAEREHEILKHKVELSEHVIRPDEHPATHSISDLTPDDIKKLDEEINEWSPEQLHQLSPKQTAAIEAAPLISMSPQQLEALPVAHLNPTELSQIFNYPSHIGILSDHFVDQITQEQAATILGNPKAKLTEYFTPGQIEHLETTAAGKPAKTTIFHEPTKPKPQASNIALRDDRTATQDITSNDFDIVKHSDAQAPMPTNKPSWWRKLSSTLSTVVDGLVKQFSRTSSLSIASDAMRQKARGTYDAKNDQAVDNAFRKLTSKQKDGVANDWLIQTKANYAEKNRVLQQDILHLSKVQSLPESVRDEHIASLKAQIRTNDQALRNEISSFTTQMKRYLSPNEQLISLENSSGMIRFECIDMSEIDPTKSIADQKQKLKDDGIINTYDANWWTGKQSSISHQTLQDLYTDWISSDIVQQFNPAKSITDQIEIAVLKLTKRQWKDFDPTIKAEIYKNVDHFLQREQQKLEQRITHDPTRTTKEEAKLIQQDIDQSTRQTPTPENRALTEFQSFAVQTSSQADQLAREVAEKRFENATIGHDVYTKEQTIEIYKKLFFEAYKNLYESLHDVPQLEHLSGHAYGDAVAKVLYDISLKMPVITDIPKDSQISITKRYIAVKGI